MPAASQPHRAWAFLADAAGIILVLDAVLLAVRGHGSIGFIFFHLPAWLPFREVWPGVLGAGILLRCRPIVAVAVAVAMWNAWAYACLRAGGHLAGWAVPFSFILAAGLLPAAFIRRHAPLPAVAVGVVVLAMAHVLTYGHTDYRRAAEAIVVFGARAYEDGTASQALRDRTMTGIGLYRQGYAGRLILSGGGIEPDVMQRMALEHGVPASAIVLDRGGLNTAATMRFLRRQTQPGQRVLAVSHSFHNARIKLLAERFGIRCQPVPAEEPIPLTLEPYYVLRECAALAAYYLTVWDDKGAGVPGDASEK